MEVAFIQDTVIYDITDGLSKHMVSNCAPYGIFILDFLHYNIFAWEQKFEHVHSKEHVGLTKQLVL